MHDHRLYLHQFISIESVKRAVSTNWKHVTVLGNYYDGTEFDSGANEIMLQ